MARKIIGGVGSLLGLKKKKAPAAAAPAAEKKGPIITQLGAALPTTGQLGDVINRRRRNSSAGGNILGGTLGG